jgi:hypothetical protein
LNHNANSAKVLGSIPASSITVESRGGRSRCVEYPTKKQIYCRNQCCRSGEFIPDQKFFIPDPGSRVKKTPDSGSGSPTKNLSIFNIYFGSGIRNTVKIEENIFYHQRGKIKLFLA